MQKSSEPKHTTGVTRALGDQEIERWLLAKGTMQEMTTHRGICWAGNEVRKMWTGKLSSTQGNTKRTVCLEWKLYVRAQWSETLCQSTE